MKLSALAVTAALLTACVAPQPADPATVAKITRICMASGFFHLVNGGLALVYPVPARLLDYGIDQVCMNPERFASDVSTVEWLLKNLPSRL
jgi:hypothetical protein